MMTEFILAALACIGTLAVALAFYFRYQGDSEIVFDTGAARDYRVVKSVPQRTIRCRCLIPLANRGRQNGMVINVFCQPMYYGKIMEQLEITARLRLTDTPPRKNGYWEAVIVKKRTSSLAELEVAICSQVDLATVASEIPLIKIIIYYQVVGRDGIQWRLAEARFALASQSP